ncbi:MAG: PilZ domain-containing protein [Myxococcota bacterium]|nr:PilZ domain-containing protein [Myxococcota bacterium]
MEHSPGTRVTVTVHAPARAFAPGVQTALMRLGYNLITPRTAEELGEGAAALQPAIRIVDDRELDQVPLETGPEALPIVLLVGHRGPVVSDARAVGTVRRRAKLNPVYEVLQRALEHHPRSVPRAETTLPVRALRGERAWAGAIRSLSEKGCLVQGARGLEPDLRVDLCFPIPGTGLLTVPAQASDVRPDGRTTLIFRDACQETRKTIAGYVVDQLAG